METSIVDEPPSQGLILLGDFIQAQIIASSALYLIIIGLILVLLLGLSAMISGSEVAFFSISLHEIDEFKKSKKTGDARIIKLLSKPKYLLATILILNNFVNIAIVTLSTYATWKMFEGAKQATLITSLTFVITFLIVFIGEIVPKIYANQQRISFARKTSGFIFLASRIVKPLSWLLVNLTSVVEKRLEKRAYDSSSMEEVHQALEMTTQSGISDEEKDILKGIVNFSTISVTQVMKSRIDLIAVENNISFHEMMDIINKEGFSRIPVYEEDIDKIEGILYVKDLLPFIDKDESFKWQDLLRPAYFVPESKMIDDLLKDFQEKRVHMAIVVDEYGGTSGLITMEDILEEIVGEISDEFDEEEQAYQQISNDTYDFEGRISVNDMCKVFKIDATYFEEIQGESESVGGMLLEELGKIPNTGEQLTFQGFNFSILAVDKRRIKKVRVKIL
ncbi:MAG: gliding motility-associated protein GldE [Bacteroidota bacterium]